MAITKGNKSESFGAVHDFIAVYDVLKYRPTGVEELVAGKGTRVPFAKAMRLGLLNKDGSAVKVSPDGKIGNTGMFYMGYVAPPVAEVKPKAEKKSDESTDKKSDESTDKKSEEKSDKKSDAKDSGKKS